MKHVVLAGVVKLADALDSKSSPGDRVSVQVRSPAPNHDNPNLVPIGDGFGLLLYFDYNFFSNGVTQRSKSKPRGREKRKLNKQKSGGDIIMIPPPIITLLAKHQTLRLPAQMHTAPRLSSQEGTDALHRNILYLAVLTSCGNIMKIW